MDTNLETWHGHLHGGTTPDGHPRLDDSEDVDIRWETVHAAEILQKKFGSQMSSQCGQTMDAMATEPAAKRLEDAQSFAQ